MSKHGAPGDFYRHLVRGLMPEENQGEVQGVDQLVAALAQALQETQAEPAPSFGRYIAATGLLACGYVEMVEVVLDNVPPPEEGTDAGGKMPYLGTNALRALLPLPQALQGEGGWNSYPDLEGVRAWFLKRQHLLRWDADQDRFVLEAVPG